MGENLSYRFRMYESKELIDTLAVYNIPVKPSQLRQPTADFVFGVCEQLLRRYGFKDAEGLLACADDSLAALQTPYPEIYRRPLAKMHLARKIGNIARSADLFDYNPVFLSMPTPQTTHILFSALVNYFAFFQMRIERANEIRDQADAVHTERTTLAKKLARERAAVDELEKTRAEEKRRERELQERTNAFVAEIQGLNKLAEGLKLTNEKTKAELERLRKRTELIVAEMTKAEEELNATRARIVQSPDRKRRTIELMRTTVEDHRRAITANEGKIRELQAKQAAFTSIERDVRTCVEQLVVIEKETAELEAAEKALIEAQDKQDRKSEHKNELLLKKENAEQQRARMHERLERMKQLAADRQTAYTQRLARLQAESGELVHERRENDREVEALVTQADAIEREMAVHLRDNQEKLDALVDAYWDLREQHVKYMESIEKKFLHQFE